MIAGESLGRAWPADPGDRGAVPLPQEAVPDAVKASGSEITGRSWRRFMNANTGPIDPSTPVKA